MAKEKKLLDQVRETIRLRHYSNRREGARIAIGSPSTTERGAES